MQGDAGELAVGVGVLGGRATADEDAGGAGAAQAGGGDLEGLGPAGGAQLAGLVAHQRGREPVGERGDVKAQRPLSQFHSSLTAGSLAAMRRRTTPRRWSVRMAHPEAQPSQTVGVEIRSKGRERKR